MTKLSRVALRRPAAAAIIVAALFVATGAPSAMAAEDPKDKIKKIKVVNAVDLDIKKGNAKNKTKKENEKVQRYIKDQSKAGRGLDLQDVYVASTDYEGGTAGVVYEAGDSLDSLIVRGTEDTDLGLGAMMVSGTGDAAVDGRAGADGGVPSNSALRGRGCRSLFFDQAYNNSDQSHYIYDCWEKFQSTAPGRGYDWFYNRYTLFDPADRRSSLYPVINLIDATIRFRPWRGRESTVAQGPFNYAPKPTTKSENSATLTVTAGPASISFPAFANGSSIQPLPRSDTHAMGTDWDGRRSATFTLDSAATFTSASNPIFADYVWQTTTARSGGNCCTVNDNDSWNDTGW